MRRYLKISIYCSIFLIADLQLKAQTPLNLEMELESIAESMDDEQADFTQFAENLEMIREWRLNINQITKYELSFIPFINAFQASNLLTYIEKYGPILSPYEIASIPGIDIETARELSKFFEFGPPEKQKFSVQELISRPRHNLMIRWDRVIEEREGFRRRRLTRQTGEDVGSHYLGDPNRYLLRYRLQLSRHLQIGLTAEKDPGEMWFNHPLGPDFLSFYIAFKDIGKIQKLIIGDYQAQFGQGLALWTSMAFGKSAMTTNTQRFGRGFFGSNGVDENRFLRGVAATSKIGKYEISGFFSRKNIDATPAGNGTFSTLQQSGLHRTPTEIAARKSLGLTSYGANINRSYRQLNLGLTMATHQFSAEIQPQEQVFRLHQFRGTSQSQAAIDYQWIWRSMQFYGEGAINQNRGKAFVKGVFIPAAHNLTLNIHYRNHQPTYHALFNAPFGVSQNAGSGEKGAYIGFEWLQSANFTSNVYIDHYEFQWLRFRNAGPSRAKDYLWQGRYRINRKSSAYMRLRWQERDQNTNSEYPIRNQDTERKLAWRSHLESEISPTWKIATRVEMSRHNWEDQTQYGWLVFQDLRFTHPSAPLTITGRYAIFDTDGFDSRIYAYEHDVLYGFSVPAYFNRGRRFYFVLKWQATKNCTFWLRFAQSTFHQTSSISSGLQEIAGNQLRDIRLQLRIKL